MAGGNGRNNNKRPTAETPTDRDNRRIIAELRDKILDLENDVNDVSELKESMTQLQKENWHIRKLAKHGNHRQLHENDVSLVVEFTKRFIYPKCQYINGELQLSKVMAILARKKNLPKDKHEEFNISFRDVVMKTVNQMRNASVQSMRRIYKGK